MISNNASVIFLGVICLIGIRVTRAGDPPAFEDVPIVYMKGVYEVPSVPTSLPVLYDSFVPLIYHFDLPKWDQFSMKIQFWKKHNNCTTSDRYTEGYPCPIMHYANRYSICPGGHLPRRRPLSLTFIPLTNVSLLNRFVEEFTGNMTYWKNLFLSNQTDADLPLISRTKSFLQDTEFYCSRITPHFIKFQTDPNQLKDYLTMIGNCGDETINVAVNLTETAVELEALYHNTFESFAASYWSLLKEGAPQEAAMVTTWSALGTTLMLHQYMETQKWSSAISSCQNNEIPWTLITHEGLKKTLSNTSHVDNLSIPLNQMAKYFKLPLTDCVFVGQDKLIVRILVPLNIIETGYQIIKFEPVVFHEEGQFCWIDGLRDKKFIMDFKNNLYLTDCSDQNQGLCRTSDHFHSSHDKADPCSLAIYNDSEEEILDACPLKCVQAEKRHENFKYFNLAYRTEDNFIYAAGDEDLDLKIECDNKTLQLIPKLDYGAWNISIPCGCKLTGFDEQMEYPVQPPCKNQYTLEKIRPYHWRSQDLAKAENKSLEESIEAEIENSTKMLQPEGGHQKMKLMEDLEERFESLNTHATIQWFLNFFFLFVIGILSFLIYHLHKWRKEELYRENRLIYSVSDNGEDLSMERQPPRH